MIYFLVILVVVLIVNLIVGYLKINKEEYRHWSVAAILDQKTISKLTEETFETEVFIRLNQMVIIKIVLLSMLGIAVLFVFQSRSYEIRYGLILMLFVVQYVTNRLIVRIFEIVKK